MKTSRETETANSRRASVNGWAIDWNAVVWHMLMLGMAWAAVGCEAPGSLWRAFMLCLFVKFMIAYNKKPQSPNAAHERPPTKTL
jgi:hypothetical protein